MKIVKYGEGYPQQVCCIECHSILEIEPGDLLRNTSMLEVGKSVVKQKISHYVICPVCGEVNVVKESFMDYGVGNK